MPITVVIVLSVPLSITVYYCTVRYNNNSDQSEYKVRVCFIVCVSLMTDGSQRARLPIPPTGTLPSFL